MAKRKARKEEPKKEEETPKEEVKEEPEVLEEVEQVSSEKKGGDRERRWAKFLEKAQVNNPVKFAIKKKNGEFDKISDSFIG